METIKNVKFKEVEDQERIYYVGIKGTIQQVDKAVELLKK